MIDLRCDAVCGLVSFIATLVRNYARPNAVVCVVNQRIEQREDEVSQMFSAEESSRLRAGKRSGSVGFASARLKCREFRHEAPAIEASRAVVGSSGRERRDS
ncbi:hypothetical protein PLANPX_5419 [Lacipirellula parvula]|uniref:Uncharacterized protein n=1 Tax=Lacipirellula parvula TaxID=2650471 RepID=A0A5K7XII2_9BACT|nr:hypothetical protein PLANPX_5419 [Lacipirellula parvula]